jgi:hypothetical protein
MSIFRSTSSSKSAYTRHDISNKFISVSPHMASCTYVFVIVTFDLKCYGLKFIKTDCSILANKVISNTNTYSYHNNHKATEQGPH